MTYDRTAARGLRGRRLLSRRGALPGRLGVRGSARVHPRDGTSFTRAVRRGSSPAVDPDQALPERQHAGPLRRALAELSSGTHHLMTLMGHGDAFKFSVGNGINPLVLRRRHGHAHERRPADVRHGDGVQSEPVRPGVPGRELHEQPERRRDRGASGRRARTSRSRPPIFHEEMLRLLFEHGDHAASARSTRRTASRSRPRRDGRHVRDRWTMLTKTCWATPSCASGRASRRRSRCALVDVPLGTASFTVTVTDSGQRRVADALVCVSDANGTYRGAHGCGRPGGACHSTSRSPGTVDVVVTKAEFIPARGDVLDLDPTAGRTPGAHGSDDLDDDGTGASSGNGDGVIDAGRDDRARPVGARTAAERGGRRERDGLRRGGRERHVRSLVERRPGSGAVFVGPDRTNPGAVPFTLDFASPSIPYIGHAARRASPRTRCWGIAGIFVWQDREGWHVRWVERTRIGR